MNIADKAREEWARLEPILRAYLPHYPDSCCTPACLLLQSVMPSLVIVEGEFDDGYIEPSDGLPSGPVGHTWLQAEDGTIIDPAHGQFDGGEPFRVAIPSDLRFAFYKPLPLSLAAEQYHTLVRDELAAAGLL